MYNQGDIVLIPFPFTDLSSSKKRPVLVLSNGRYNDLTDDFICVAVTTNVDDKTYIVKISNSDMKEGKLAYNSCVRADKIYTLSQSIALKKFGAVNDDIIKSVKEKLFQIIA